MQQYINLVLLSFFFVSPITAQNISVSFTAETRQNGTQIYKFGNYYINITNTFVDIKDSKAYFSGYESIALSKKGALASILTKNSGGKVEVFGFNGVKIRELTSINFSSDDPSLKTYILPNGEIIVRSNIANFAFYDALGNLENIVSNNTSAKQGESISELAKDEHGSTILAYNPKIFVNDHPGSRITRIDRGKNKKVIYNNDRRYIKTLQLSKNGEFITIVSARENTPDLVIVMDKFGNKLTEIEAREEIKKVSFSGDYSHITLISDGRMSVYKVVSGERIGSSSTRGVPLIFAEYFPEDNVLIGLAGNYSEQTHLVSETELKVIDFNRREIVSAEVDEPLTMTPHIPLDFQREASYEYLLNGLNKHMVLKPAF